MTATPPHHHRGTARRQDGSCDSPPQRDDAEQDGYSAPPPQGDDAEQDGYSAPLPQRDDAEQDGCCVRPQRDGAETDGYSVTPLWRDITGLDSYSITSSQSSGVALAGYCVTSLFRVGAELARGHITPPQRDDTIQTATGKHYNTADSARSEPGDAPVSHKRGWFAG